MNLRKVSSFVLAISLAFVPVVLAGCGAGGGSAAEQSHEVTLANAELLWCGYTMGIDCATADQERISDDISGMGIRITFHYIGDESGNGGFDGAQLFDLIDANPIVLTDASGTEYRYTDSLTDVQFTITGNDFAISNAMPRFGIIFDVPAGTDIGDYTLSVGDGNELRLEEFITDEYAAYIAE